MARHIVAIGGAGLSERLLRRFVLDLTGKPRPRILYIPTANGDSPEGIVMFYEAFSQESCQPSHLPLFMRKHEDLAPVILDQDVIYVGGGNTANMLAVWRIQGVDKLLRQAWDNGTVLCGASAGSICWFEGGITDSFGLQLAELHDGLGFLSGSNCPHYDSEALRRPAYTQAVANSFLPGLAAEDAVAFHFVDRDLAETVSARRNARGFRVEARDGQAVETPLPVRYLGG
ncbi:MAG: Type 1 glutamine amidotransferase-like domain-containing protein [Chloroflexota bacterium]